VTTPCIGWEGDTPCPHWGQYHGCTLPDGHSNWAHECVCGAIPDGEHRPRYRSNVCGTNAGYQRHNRNRETPCDACTEAARNYKRSLVVDKRRTVVEQSDPGDADNAPGSGQRHGRATT
jgi:hypothetical protein